MPNPEPTTAAGRRLALRLADYDRDYYHYGEAIAEVEAEARAAREDAPTRECGCTLDAAEPGPCPRCQHREHGASGCRARVLAAREDAPLDVAAALWEALREIERHKRLSVTEEYGCAGCKDIVAAGYAALAVLPLAASRAAGGGRMTAEPGAALEAMAGIAAPPASHSDQVAIDTLGMAMAFSSVRIKAGVNVKTIHDRAQLVVDELEVLGYYLERTDPAPRIDQHDVEHAGGEG